MKKKITISLFVVTCIFASALSASAAWKNLTASASMSYTPNSTSYVVRGDARAFTDGSPKSGTGVYVKGTLKYNGSVVASDDDYDTSNGMPSVTLKNTQKKSGKWRVDTYAEIYQDNGPTIDTKKDSTEEYVSFTANKSKAKLGSEKLMITDNDRNKWMQYVDNSINEKIKIAFDDALETFNLESENLKYYDLGEVEKIDGFSNKELQSLRSKIYKTIFEGNEIENGDIYPGLFIGEESKIIIVLFKSQSNGDNHKFVFVKEDNDWAFQDKETKKEK
ncbi:hypothetical protein [Brevibacillus parabrevis]|uniref:hypothetical protein n=1 Tax=Brevibacillus parabrevis TaxID=54914 RepID=UPI001F600EAA|nr:hypothetical protein [Brevibacillus parabrevis]